MDVTNEPLFPYLGERYTAIYLAGPLNDFYEERESVGRRLDQISLGDDAISGRYLIYERPGNGLDGIWFYVWDEPTD